MGRAKAAGVGAIGKTKMVFLHPSAPLVERFGTAYQRDYLPGLVILSKDRRKVSKKGCIVDHFSIQHLDFPDVHYFRVASRNFSVTQEGETPFEVAAPPAPAPAPTAATQPHARESTQEAAHALTQPGRTITADAIAELRAQGFTVDDDNEPVEENAENPGPPPIGTWLRPTTCRRAGQGHLKLSGRWAGVSWATVAEMDELQLFLLCFPVEYIKKTVLPETNKYMAVTITLKEFFCVYWLPVLHGMPSRCCQS